MGCSPICHNIWFKGRRYSVEGGGGFVSLQFRYRACYPSIRLAEGKHLNLSELPNGELKKLIRIWRNKTRVSCGYEDGFSGSCDGPSNKVTSREVENLRSLLRRSAIQREHCHRTGAFRIVLGNRNNPVRVRLITENIALGPSINIIRFTKQVWLEGCGAFGVYFASRLA